jgi:Putative zinc dependent peptidase (DUF5700)
MINHVPATNNIPRIFLLLATCLVISLLPWLSGCENDSGTNSGERPEAKPVEIGQCGVTIDDTAWNVFADISRRATAGETVGPADFQVFADLPIMPKWRESLPNNIPASYVVNWLDYTFDSHFNRDGKKKYNQYQKDYSRSYLYTIDHLEEITPKITSFATGDFRCQLVEKVNFWLPPGTVSDSLVVVFLPSRPEIRVFEKYIFVDTGILFAGNHNQLVSQLAALIFRDRMMLSADNPAKMDGRPALATIFYATMKEGLAGYIEDQLETIFAQDHPKVGVFNIVPEYVFGGGRQVISMLNEHLPAMLADEAVMMKNGNNLVRTLITAHIVNYAGYSMSATIADKFGDERLRDTMGSPAAWLRAYQEAALLNPSPAPEPVEVINNWSMSMPPLNDVAYNGLLEILETAFPAP